MRSSRISHGCSCMAGHRFKELDMLYGEVTRDRTFQVDHPDGFSPNNERDNQLAFHLFTKKPSITRICVNVRHINDSSFPRCSSSHWSPFPILQFLNLYPSTDRFITRSVLNY